MNTERLPIVMERAMQNWVEAEQVLLPTCQAQDDTDKRIDGKMYLEHSPKLANFQPGSEFRSTSAKLLTQLTSFHCRVF